MERRKIKSVSDKLNINLLRTVLTTDKKPNKEWFPEVGSVFS